MQVYCNCISWPASLKHTLGSRVTKLGAILLLTSPLPLAVEGGAVCCHLEGQFRLYQTHVAQTFTPRGRIFVYVRQRSYEDAAAMAASC